MRAAFEESVAESAFGSTGNSGGSASGSASASANGGGSSGGGDGDGGGGKHHWLRKVVAQIAFGLHLLHAGLARSDAAVVRILQGHVADVDGFLRRTGAELDAAARDASRRMALLGLPLAPPRVRALDRLLASRAFRREMAARCAAADAAVARAACALRAALGHVREGLAAAADLARYLPALARGWRSPALARVLSAMRHNCALWLRACTALHARGARLGAMLDALAAVVAETERRTAAASRRHLVGPRPPAPGPRFPSDAD